MKINRTGGDPPVTRRVWSFAAAFIVHERWRDGLKRTESRGVKSNVLVLSLLDDGDGGGGGESRDHSARNGIALVFTTNSRYP